MARLATLTGTTCHDEVLCVNAAHQLIISCCLTELFRLGLERAAAMLALQCLPRTLPFDYKRRHKHGAFTALTILAKIALHFLNNRDKYMCT